MVEQMIQVKEQDREQLLQIVRDQLMGGEPVGELMVKLERAEILHPDAACPDLVVLNSTVRLLNLETRQEVTYRLVLPEEASPAEGKVSVLSPGQLSRSCRQGTSR